MVNRAERRAQAKQDRRNTGAREDRTRSRAGVMDEYALQERSRRLLEHGTGEWKPTATTTTTSETSDPTFSNPDLVRKPHSLRQTFRIVSWTFIVLSMIAFFIVMWLPQRSVLLVGIVSAIFAIAVLSLFVVSGDSRHNPNLDAHGTAV